MAIPNFEYFMNKTKTIYVSTQATNLNDYTEEGKYWFNYANTPISKPPYVENNAGYLEVIKADELYILQRWTVYQKDTIWERQKVNGTWNDWHIVSKQPVLLWQDTGGSYMQGNQQANLSQPISAQQNGIILLFQPYRDGNPTGWGHHMFFFSKKYLDIIGEGYGQSIIIPDSDAGIQAGKYLYFFDNYIKGNDSNGQIKTMFGTQIDCRKAVLTAVWGI